MKVELSHSRTFISAARENRLHRLDYFMSEWRWEFRMAALFWLPGPSIAPAPGHGLSCNAVASLCSRGHSCFLGASLRAPLLPWPILGLQFKDRSSSWAHLHPKVRMAPSCHSTHKSLVPGRRPLSPPQPEAHLPSLPAQHPAFRTTCP